MHAFETAQRWLSISLFVVLPFAVSCGSVSEPAKPLIVTVSATPETGIEPLVVSFTAVVQGFEFDTSPLAFEWDFGDGAFGTSSQPGHTYQAAGTYPVSVLVKGPDKREGTGVLSLNVDPKNKGVDLTIDSVTIEPPQINPGGTVSVKVNVLNAGTDDVANGVVVRLFVMDSPTWPGSGTPSGAINIGGLAGESSVEAQGTAVVSTGAQEGAHYVYAYVDGPDISAIDEFDENNNVGTSVLPVGVTFGPLPIDLVVETIETDLGGNPAVAGQPVTLTTTVRNDGTQAAEGFRLAYRLSIDPTVSLNSPDFPLGALVDVPGLPPGSSTAFPVTFDMPAGYDNRPYYMGVYLDPLGEVPETDEDNNVGTYSEIYVVTGANGCTEDALEPNETEGTAVALTGNSFPNLELCPFSEEWFAVDLVKGDRLTASIDFDTTVADLSFDLVEGGSAVVSSVGAGNTESVASPLVLADTTYYLRVYGSVGVAGIPYDLNLDVTSSGGNGRDLVPDNLVVGPNPAGSGQNLVAGWDVRNLGTDDVTATSSASVHLSSDATLDAADTLLSTVAIPAIVSDGSHLAISVTPVPMGLAPGTYFVIITQDSASDITETYEDNNTLVGSVDINTGCIEDLFEPNDELANPRAVTSGSISARVCVGDYDYYSVLVPNNTTLNVDILFSDAEGNIHARLRSPTGGYLDSSFSSTDNENLNYTNNTGSLQTYIIQLYTTVEEGAFPGNSYTVNITGAVSLTTDFIAESLSFSPGAADPGEGVQADFAVTNMSTADSAAFDIGVYLSTDTIADPSDFKVGTVNSASLAALETRNYTKKFTVPAGAAGGLYYVIASVDDTNSIAEAQEGNNQRPSLDRLDVNSVCVEDAFEDNDSSSAPGSVNTGSSTALQICANDEDWFEFTSGASGTIDIRIDFMNANGDLDLLIYEDDGVTLLGSSVSDVLNTETVQINAAAGTTYKIRAKGFNDAQNNYTLTVSSP